jgi:hypothetical protein
VDLIGCRKSNGKFEACLNKECSFDDAEIFNCKSKKDTCQNLWKYVRGADAAMPFLGPEKTTGGATAANKFEAAFELQCPTDNALGYRVGAELYQQLNPIGGCKIIDHKYTACLGKENMDAASCLKKSTAVVDKQFTCFTPVNAAEKCEGKMQAGLVAGVSLDKTPGSNTGNKLVAPLKDQYGMKCTAGKVLISRADDKDKTPKLIDSEEWKKMSSEAIFNFGCKFTDEGSDVNVKKLTGCFGLTDIVDSDACETTTQGLSCQTPEQTCKDLFAATTDQADFKSMRKKNFHKKRIPC